jgi:hypothetical protein
VRDVDVKGHHNKRAVADTALNSKLPVQDQIATGFV